jgi:hypothetical protein
MGFETMGGMKVLVLKGIEKQGNLWAVMKAPSYSFISASIANFTDAISYRQFWRWNPWPCLFYGSK